MISGIHSSLSSSTNTSNGYIPSNDKPAPAEQPIDAFVSVVRVLLVVVDNRKETASRSSHLVAGHEPPYPLSNEPACSHRNRTAGLRRCSGRPFSGTLVLEVPASVPISDLVEVHPPSVRSVDLSGVTIRVSEDPGPRPPVPPAPVVTAGPVSGGTVSLTMADEEVEVYELVRKPAL